MQQSYRFLENFKFDYLGKAARGLSGEYQGLRRKTVFSVESS